MTGLFDASGYPAELFDASGFPTPEARAAHGAVRRHDAEVAVDANADPEWKKRALDFIERYLRDHEFLFVDDLWAAGLERPPEARALGSVMKTAGKNGWMEHTGTGRPSVASNGAMKPVWRSLLHWSLATTKGNA